MSVEWAAAWAWNTQLGLVAGGADSDEIASRCGLSRGEAELLLHLQALQRGEARRAA